MTLLLEPEYRFVDSLLHPTDRSEASLSAFHHAVAIAVHRGAELTLLHCRARRSSDSWSDFPRVRDTLARWRANGMRPSVEKTLRQTRVKKLEVESRDPVQASMEHMERHGTDMIVLATEGRSGLARLVRPSRAEELARRSRIFTLFVPHGVRPFVSAATGEITLKRILIPLDGRTDPRPAMLRAVRSAALLDDPQLEVTLLHVGEDGDEALVPDLPQLPFCRWNAVRKRGEPATEILALAAEIGTDAIYMTTAWSRHPISSVEPGVTEAVLHGARCPVATVPVD